MLHSEDAIFFNHLHTIFASLQPEEVEQFYSAYRQWLLQQRIVELRQRLAATQEEIVENELRIQQARPSPIALASLARLQANGVDDVEVLDQMLERGETWLDATMQRLDYCEQFENFLADDYTQWARLALDGAFDWIDSALIPTPTLEAATDEEHASSMKDACETEAQLLHKLTSEEDDLSWQEPTLKQAAIRVPSEEPINEEPEPAETPIEPVPAEPEPIVEPPANEEPETLESQNAQEEEAEPVVSQQIPPRVPRKQSLSRRFIGKLLGE